MKDNSCSQDLFLRLQEEGGGKRRSISFERSNISPDFFWEKAGESASNREKLEAIASPNFAVRRRGGGGGNCGERGRDFAWCNGGETR
jgi:hypothetical protein